MPDTTKPFQDSALTNILVVSDLAAAKTFYLDQLGGELYREYNESSVLLRFLGSWIWLTTPGGPTHDKPETDFVAPADPHKVSHAFTIRVQDCRASYKILKERGISFITPPYAHGPETRCFFRDPDGHLFEISEYQG